MTTQPAPVPQQPQRRGLPPLAIIGIVVGGIVTLCCLGGVALAVIGAFDDADPNSPDAPTAPAIETPTEFPAPPATDGPSEPTSPAAAALLTVPDNLVGQNAAVAEDQLRQLGFENIEFGSADPDDTIVLLPQNWTVTEVAPEPGTELRADSVIVLTCTKQ